jgi:hypothetical protein
VNPPISLVGMDETFAFIAPVMPRRTVHPIAVKAGVISFVFVAVVGALGVFVVQHEQAADAARNRLAAQTAAIEQQRIAATEASANVPVGMAGTLDQVARDAAEGSLGYAQAAWAADHSFDGAGPGELATIGSELLFVDGPSTSPRIVSVATDDRIWAAAVASPEGCVWISLLGDGTVARDRGTECTGAAALTASGDGW